MERRKDLDFAKGVGIILMVLGHCYSSGNGENILCWLYSFHMPLFFIIPGVLYGMYNSHTKVTLGKIIKKKVLRLLIPYFFFSTITAIFLCILGRKMLVEFVAYMLRVLKLQGINAMWFIPCFLASEVIFVIANRTKHATVWNMIIVLVGLIAVCFPILKQVAPEIQRLIIGTSFISIGALCAKIYVTSTKLLLWIGCAALHLMLAMWNRCVDLAYGVYGNPMLYYLNGLLGTFVVIQAYTLLEKSRLGQAIVWLGKNTIVVLCTSSMVIEILRLVDYKFLHSILPTLCDAEGLILCTSVIMIEYVVILFCNRYLRCIVGKTNTVAIR